MYVGKYRRYTHKMDHISTHWSQTRNGTHSRQHTPTHIPTTYKKSNNNKNLGEIRNYVTNLPRSNINIKFGHMESRCFVDEIFGGVEEFNIDQVDIVPQNTISTKLEIRKGTLDKRKFVTWHCCIHNHQKTANENTTEVCWSRGIQTITRKHNKKPISGISKFQTKTWTKTLIEQKQDQTTEKRTKTNNLHQ